MTEIEFKTVKVIVQLALGEKKERNARVAMVKVQALNKEATLPVIFFPGLTTKSCLLGLDFHYKAETVLDFKQLTQNTDGQMQVDSLIETNMNAIDIENQIENNELNHNQSLELLKIVFCDGTTGEEFTLSAGEQPPEISEYEIETQPEKGKPQNKIAGRV